MTSYPQQDDDRGHQSRTGSDRVLGAPHAEGLLIDPTPDNR